MMASVPKNANTIWRSPNNGGRKNMELMGTAYCMTCGQISIMWTGHMHGKLGLVAVGFCSDKCKKKARNKSDEDCPDCPNDMLGCYGSLDETLGLAWELHPDGDLLYQRGEKKKSK
jgi:hypothetical protein